MSLQTFLLIISSVSLSAFAQITLKYGMSHKSVTDIISNTPVHEILPVILTTPYIIGGLSLYGIGAIAWLFVLAKLDVTIAYPFVGLGFILTMLLGAFLLGENLTIPKILGTLLVVCGVVLLSR